MTEFWSWLEMLPLAARIGESWWFPLLESIHVLTAIVAAAAAPSDASHRTDTLIIREQRATHRT